MLAVGSILVVGSMVLDSMVEDNTLEHSILVEVRSKDRGHSSSLLA